MKSIHVARFLAVTGFAIFLAAGLHAEDSASGILAKVDSYREFAKGGFSFDFTLVDEKGAASVMRVYLNGEGRDSSLGRYREPKKYARRVVLTVGNAFYVCDRGMASPIRITPREMLFGQASAGDITRIVYSGLYTVESSGRKGDELALRLRAIPDKGATYELVDLRVKPESGKPIAAVCRGTSGSAIKEISYDRYAVVGGKELLSEFTITDSVSGKSSKVSLGNFDRETLAPSDFTVEAMKYAK
jgi:hypothetical protein